jgi:glycosyltransferase involved in cell wall biosynthesis
MAVNSQKKRAIKAPHRKIKVLVYADSPTSASGFSTVTRNIFYYLAKTGNYDIDILGINEVGGWHDPDIHPYHIYPAQPAGEKDPYGRGRLIDIVRGGNPQLQPPWDLLFFLNDPFILEQKVPFFKLGTLPAIKDIQKTHYTKLPPDMWFKTIGYFPIDSPLKPAWVTSAIGLVDQPVLYTNYALTQFEQANWQLPEPLTRDIAVIPHGNNFADYYQLDERVITQFRHEFFQGAVRPDTFLVIVVGRNQFRKDIPRAMRIFKEFQRRRPDSFLYVHAQDQDDWGSLSEVAHALGLEQQKDWNFPNDFQAHIGYPATILNGIYNSAQVHLNTSLGEGWGLPITESMAAGTLNLAPAHTSIPELFNLPSKDDQQEVPSAKELTPSYLKNIRGIPLKTGSTSSEWICWGNKDLERLRPLTNVDDAVQKLLWVYDHEKETKAITKRASKWIADYHWKSIAHTWDKLFKQTFNQLEQERNSPQDTVNSWRQLPPTKA